MYLERLAARAHGEPSGFVPARAGQQAAGQTVANLEDPFEDAPPDVIPTTGAPEIQPNDTLGVRRVPANPSTKESLPHRDNSAAVQHDMGQHAHAPRSVAPGASRTNDSNAENVDAFAAPSSAPAPASRDDITPSAPRTIQPVQREFSERLARSTERTANPGSIGVVDARHGAASQPIAEDRSEPGQHPQEQLVRRPSDQQRDSTGARTGTDETPARQAEYPPQFTEQLAQMLVPLTSGSHGSATPGELSSRDDSTTLSIGSITVELTPPPATPEQRAPRRRSASRSSARSRSTAARPRNSFGLGQV